MRKPQQHRNSTSQNGHSRRPLLPQEVIATVQDPWTRWPDVPGGDVLASQLILDPQDRELAEIFSLVRDDQIRKAMLSADPFWPNYPSVGQLPLAQEGRIPIAALPTGDVLSIGIEDVLKNVLIVGPTGGGKTNAIKAIISAILEGER